MNIATAADARAWLRAWGNRPRQGVLRAVIAGVELAARLSTGRAAKNLEAAAQVLRAARR